MLLICNTLIKPMIEKKVCVAVTGTRTLSLTNQITLQWWPSLLQVQVAKFITVLPDAFFRREKNLSA